MKKQIFAMVLIALYVLSGCKSTDSSIEAENGVSKQKLVTEDAVSLNEETDYFEITYIANISTKKLHYPWCPFVGKMKEKNKVYLECSVDEATVQGYIPCKKCNP